MPLDCSTLWGTDYDGPAWERIDVLVDCPGDFTVARRWFPKGIRYEIVVNVSADPGDVFESLGHELPPCARYIGFRDTDTMGTTSKEITAYWWAGDSPHLV